MLLKILDIISSFHTGYYHEIDIRGLNRVETDVYLDIEK